MFEREYGTMMFLSHWIPGVVPTCLDKPKSVQPGC